MVPEHRSTASTSAWSLRSKGPLGWARRSPELTLMGSRRMPVATTWVWLVNRRASSMNAKYSTCPVSSWGVVVRERVPWETCSKVVTKGSAPGTGSQNCTGVFRRTSSSR